MDNHFKEGIMKNSGIESNQLEKNVGKRFCQKFMSMNLPDP